MTAARQPRVLQPIPANRSYDSVRHHYEVESAIARRLMTSDREARKRIYSTMYDELFAQVPDHPRLTRRADPARTADMNRRKMQLITPFLHPEASVLEFGAGDCRFAFEVARSVRRVFAVDIADQIGSDAARPDNFELVVYNGYDLDLAPGTIDTAFSDQLIEHLHPEDTEHHFRIVQRVLRPGGVYIFRTPNRLTGPHDVSRYFSTRAEGFHLKEWTFGELSALLAETGFREIDAYWFGRGHLVKVPLAAFRTVESLLRRLPLSLRSAMNYVIPGITLAAYK